MRETSRFGRKSGRFDRAPVLEFGLCPPTEALPTERPMGLPKSLPLGLPEALPVGLLVHFLRNFRLVPRLLVLACRWRRRRGAPRV